MKMKNEILILLVIFFSCTHSTPSYQNKENVDTLNWIFGNTTRPIEKLVPLVLKGDTNAYYELYIAYMDIDRSSFLPYALLMANKYDYTIAYYDVYECLTLLFWGNCDNHVCYLDSLDIKTRKMALEYLIKGAEKGEYNCLRDLGWLYFEGKHVEKDTLLGKLLLEKSKAR